MSTFLELFPVLSRGERTFASPPEPRRRNRHQAPCASATQKNTWSSRPSAEGCRRRVPAQTRLSSDTHRKKESAAQGRPSSPQAAGRDAVLRLLPESTQSIPSRYALSAPRPPVARSPAVRRPPTFPPPGRIRPAVGPATDFFFRTPPGRALPAPESEQAHLQRPREMFRPPPGTFNQKRRPPKERSPF